MSRSTIPAFLIAAVMLLAGGWILALVVDPAALLGMPRPTTGEEAGHEDHDDAHEGHVHLNEAAYRNLQLRIRPVSLSEGKHFIQVPGEIVEKPGHSDHALAAPVNGIVTEVYALPGQAIRPNDPLFKLQVIDEPLATAQLNLLNIIARLATVSSELKRVSPLADSGTVLGRKKLELEYEQNELTLKQRLYEQELAVRGLEESQIAEIKEDKELIREFVVRMPNDEHTTLPDENEPSNGIDSSPETGANDDLTRTNSLAHPLRAVSSTTMGHDWEYTLEELKVFPGKSVARGDDLCHVAYHTTLYIQGQVFENELPYILELGESEKQDWTVTALFGSHDGTTKKEGLTVHYVDNHVDPESQTYQFYLRLKNDVIRDTVDDEGRRFRTWKYKPGQRVHLRVPIAPYANQIVLPRSAVATEGANMYVFREVTELSAEEEAHGHSHAGDDVFIDLERVSIVAEYQDSSSVFVRPDGDLRPGDRIATNNAYQLYLEQKSQTGGAAAGHGHEH